jgi:hypothetical protein
MKLKIKNWKGLYTNVDENDQSLDFARTSINFKHNRGFLEFEDRALSEYQLPVIDSSLEAYDWKWETGIYCTLTSDNLSQAPVTNAYDILFVIAKAWDAGTSRWHRLFYFKDLTNNLAWQELSSLGTVANIDIPNYGDDWLFTDSIMSTDIDGKAFFIVEGGRLKIYLPHDCFWFGRVERAFYGPNQWGLPFDSVSQWYLSKLIDNKTSDNRMTELDFTATVTTTGTVFVDKKDAIATYESTVLAGSNLKSAGSKVYYDKYFIRDEDGNFVSNPIAIDEENAHWFPTFSLSGSFTYIYIPIEYASLLTFINPSGVEQTLEDICGAAITANFSNVYDEPWPNGFMTSPTFQYYRLTRTLGSGSPSIQYLTDPTVAGYQGRWAYGGGTVAEDGFDDTVESYSLVATCVYDEREEVILSNANNILSNSNFNKWAIEITGLTLNNTASKRVTRVRFYVKPLDGTTADFELVKDINYLDPDITTTDISRFYIYPSSMTGVTLNDNIGFLLDEDEPYWYNVEEGFNSITTVNDISFGLTSTNNTGIYYSTLAGGNLMPDLLYSTSLYVMNNVSKVTAIANVNEKFGIFTDDTLYLLSIIDELGVILFDIKSTLEFGVKNQYDVAQIQGGVVINTRHGIYTTTGTQSNLISEPIDDLLKDNFDTSRIYYNKDIHEIYYKISTSEDLYRFRFKDQVWELISKTWYDVLGEPVLLNANDILIDISGKIAYLGDSVLHIYDNTDTTEVTGQVISPSTDLGEPSVDKLMNGIDIDYIGQISIGYYFEGQSQPVIQDFTYTATRTTVWREYPLIHRKAFQKLAYFILTNTKGTKVYGIEFDVNPLKRRRYN